MKTRRMTRALISAMLVVMLVLSSICTPVFAAQGQPDGKSTNALETNRFIIKYKNEQGSNDVGRAIKNKTEKTKKIKNKKNKHIEVITTNKKMNKDELLNEIKSKNADSNIEYIQPDYEVNLSSNDTYFSSQWGISSSDNTTTSAISANVGQAWDVSQGDGVTIAIIDSGVDITHEDLKDNIWTNTKEISGNGIDDDGNGYIDDTNGWNFCDDNNLAHDQSIAYDEEHGTHVAGIIAAVKDNNMGIAGVAPKAKIIPLKAFKNGIANTSDIIAAIEYAENNGAKIVNCSWGSTDDNPALKEAIEDSNMLFVCAAGNNGANIDINPVYPASYTSSNVITVASLDTSGSLSSTSNYGINSVAVAAPGEGIFSTLPGNTYGHKSGTSMAAPFVSGEAALILSKYGSLIAADIKHKIISYSYNTGSLADKVSNGSIDCNYAVTGQNDNTSTQHEPTQGNTDDTLVFNLVTNSAIGLFSGETYASQKTTSTIIPVPSGSVSGQFNAVLQGSTEFNVIKNGSFEKGLDNWSVGASVKIQSSGSINGTSCIKTVPNSQAPSYVYKDIAFPNGHKVYVSGMLYPESYTSGYKSQLRMYGFGVWTDDYFIQSVDTSKLNQWQRSSTVITTVNGGIRLLVGRPAPGVESTRVDGIMAIDLTVMYGAGNEPTPAECDAKYASWFGGAKSTSSVRAKSMGKNLCPNIDKWTLENGAVLSNGYISLPNTNSKATSPFIKWGKQATPKFQATLNCSDASRSNNYVISWMYYDANFNEIGGNGAAGLVTPINSDYVKTIDMSDTGWATKNAEYVQIILRRESTYALSTYKFKDISLSNVAFGYEPYTESTLYIPNNIEVRSVGGTKDEINLSTGDLIRRTGQVVLNGSENWSGFTLTSNNSLFAIVQNWGTENNAKSTTEMNALGCNDINSFSINSAIASNPNTFGIGDPSNYGKGLYLALDKSIATNVTDLQSFKQYLSQHPVTLTYQLEQTQKNYINITPLTCYENGTVIIDNAVKDIATYNNWVGVSNSNLPIKSIESIYKIDGSLKTSVDISRISKASDGLSFTIAGAQKGEMYEYIYYYDSSLSTMPTIDFSVPTNSQAQITDNTNMINELSKKLNDLMDRVKILEDNTTRVINYEYDDNGRLIRKTVN